MSMEGVENHEPPRLCIEFNVPRGGQKLAVLHLQHGATIQSAVEATVDLHCKIVCFNQLFGDVNIIQFYVKNDNLFFFQPNLAKGPRKTRASPAHTP